MSKTYSVKLETGKRKRLNKAQTDEVKAILQTRGLLAALTHIRFNLITSNVTFLSIGKTVRRIKRDICNA